MTGPRYLLDTNILSDLIRHPAGNAARRIAVGGNDAVAQAANTHGEREKYEAIAQVWREVAEQFRAENESLWRQIAEELNTQRTLSKSEALALQPTIESRRSETIVVIGDKASSVPALPNAHKLP